MEKCSLCRINDADKTGSHLITHSLIKTAINEPGSTKRDKEIAYQITAGKEFSTDVYFGRNVLPDTIEAELNKKFDDSDIEKNINSLVEDYLFCTPCEKRFTIIEDEFISSIYKPLQEKKIDAYKDSLQNKLIFYDTKDDYITRLFFYIQLWRMSVSKDNFKLSPKFEEHLRRIIDKCLENNIEKTLENCEKFHEELTKFPISVTFLETDIHTENNYEYTTNLIYLHPNSNMPYFCLFNDIIVTLYEKESHLRSTPKHLFGLTNLIEPSEHINLQNNKFKIGVLNDEKRKAISREVYTLPIDLFIDMWRCRIILLHKAVFNFRPSSGIVNKILAEIMELDIFPINKNNREEIIKVISKNFYRLLRN